jgi:hypothetical protein
MFIQENEVDISLGANLLSFLKYNYESELTNTVRARVGVDFIKVGSRA